MKSYFKVNEIFSSIQGEGKNVGKPRMFIRLQGCNMTCPFCDSKKTYTEPGYLMPVEEMAERISAQNLAVVWTGGEPSLQQEKIIACRDLVDWSIGFDIETNGKKSLIEPEYYSTIVVSPKLTGGIDSISEIVSRFWEIHSHYSNVVFKFAVEDPVVVKQILEKYPIDKDIVYAMQITPDTFREIGDEVKAEKEFALKCLDLGVNYSPRIQRFFQIA